MLCVCVTGDAKKELDNIVNTIKQAIAPNITKVSISELQIQAIISLLQSYGADQITMNSVEGVFRGRQPFIPIQTNIKTQLSKPQIRSIISLLHSFGADAITIINLEKVLDGPYIAS